MKAFGSRQVVAILLAAFAALFGVVGHQQLGFWDPVNGPGPGFFPCIMSVVMFVMSVVTFIQSFNDKKEIKYTKDEAIVIISATVLVAMSFVIGLIPSCAIFVLWWMKILQKESWKNTIIVMAISMGIALGVFQEWLGIDFPLGLIDELR